MNHTPPIFIEYGKNSSAFFSVTKPENLVIFIHGFNGSATGTWDDFPSLIRTNNDFVNSDVIFYGYESLKGQANNNAIKFYNFLKSVCENSPNKLGFRRDNLGKDFVYERILIVAHSLGAIIVRRALLNAKSENKNWLNKCKMILFAPAHKGARIQNLIAESFPNINRIFILIGLMYTPVLDDLKPNSQTILNLISDSKYYIDRNVGDFTIAHRVIWANNEFVVHNDQFCNDPIAILIDNKSHTSVCKPKNVNFLEPYSIVVTALLSIL